MKNIQIQNITYKHQCFYLYTYLLAHQLNLLVLFRNISLIGDSLSTNDITPITDSFVTDNMIPMTDFFPENDIIPINTSYPVNNTVKEELRKNIIRNEIDKCWVGDSDIPKKINSKGDSKEESIPKCKPTTLPEKEIDATNEKYKSPLKKLVVFFEKSRDQWKDKCLDAKYKLKITKYKAKKLEADRNKWKNEATTLKNELFNIRHREKILRHELDNLKKKL